MTPIDYVKLALPQRVSSQTVILLGILVALIGIIFTLHANDHNAKVRDCIAKVESRETGYGAESFYLEAHKQMDIKACKR